MRKVATRFGSLNSFEKGGVDIINDDPRNYAFSNIYEVAASAAPFERVCVAKNEEYVLEGMRCEGTSMWFASAHGESVLVADGSFRIDFIKLADTSLIVSPVGANALDGEPDGQPMGNIIASTGHMIRLPAGCAYRFTSEAPAALILQSIAGPLTVERWGEICQTHRLRDC